MELEMYAIVYPLYNLNKLKVALISQQVPNAFPL